MLQASHDTVPFKNADSNIHLLCDGVQGPANVGALFRLADAFGVQKLYFGNADINFDSDRLKRTARNTLHAVQYSVCEDLKQQISALKSEQIPVYALEITSNSVPLQQLPKRKKGAVALIIGNERHGISEEILKEADAVFHINMFGANSSMNVIQATAIGLYALTKDL